MYILQTTTAVLIAFLAIIAYSKVRNRLARGWPKEKDVETVNSFTGLDIKDVQPPIRDADSKETFRSGEVDTADEGLVKLKELYYKLHNLEHYPEVLPECRELLLTLLSSTISDAIKEPENTILSVENFSPDELKRFLKAKDIDVTNRWEEYLARRRAGGPREMFSDREEAKWWLKQAAPVKYVDGAWLGHINKISTPFKYRQITKNAWQVMSEELGDGDLAKNHVQVYQDLMDDIDARLPAADTKDFIHPRHGLSEVRCWKAALAQLTISLFPHDFLPEALGFNMAYESLPLHLLKTVKELRELRLNPYYFELHISIDNSDSGHAAMAMAAVSNYMSLIEADQGEDAARIAWKRVQAGYILAEGLPTTPESPSLKTHAAEPFPRTETEAQLVSIFAAKSAVAHKIHCNSRLRIGRRSLVDWLEPTAFQDAKWQKDFLDDLSTCKPWVMAGRSAQSRLIRELSWEGKMFGSFTEKEVGIVSAWIDELASHHHHHKQEEEQVAGVPDQTPVQQLVYWKFTGQISDSDDTRDNSDMGAVWVRHDWDRDSNILSQYPVFARSTGTSTDSTTTKTTASISCTPEPTAMHETNDLTIGSVPRARTEAMAVVLNASSGSNTQLQLHLSSLLPLWFASPALLEALPTVPVRAARPFGSAIVRVLRAQSGFSAEGTGVAGMDEVQRTEQGQAVGIVELGLQMCRSAGLVPLPSHLGDVVVRRASCGGDENEDESVLFSEHMLALGMRWLAHRDLLVGMAWAFMELHEVLARSEGGAGAGTTLLSASDRRILQDIAMRERKGLQVCKEEIWQEEHRKADFTLGVAQARRAIQACFTQ